MAESEVSCSHVGMAECDYWEVTMGRDYGDESLQPMLWLTDGFEDDAATVGLGLLHRRGLGLGWAGRLSWPQTHMKRQTRMPVATSRFGPQQRPVAECL